MPKNYENITSDTIVEPLQNTEGMFPVPVWMYSYAMARLFNSVFVTGHWEIVSDWVSSNLVPLTFFFPSPSPFHISSWQRLALP